MFKEGNILYFNPFYFDNGNTPKPKYFYYFQAGKVVAYNEKDEREFFFPRDTYVYGYRISFFDLKKFEGLIKGGQCDVTYKGKMTDAEYKQLKDCLKKSSSVKRAFRRIL